MRHGIKKLFGWPIDRQWILDYAKAHGYDYGVMYGLALGSAKDVLGAKSGIDDMLLYYSQADREFPKLILTLYVDLDCWYDVDTEQLITPEIPEENIEKLLKLIGKEGEKPKWWPYMSRDR